LAYDSNLSEEHSPNLIDSGNAQSFLETELCIHNSKKMLESRAFLKQTKMLEIESSSNI